MKYLILLLVLLVGLAGCAFFEAPVEEIEEGEVVVEEMVEEIELYSVSVNDGIITLNYEKNFDTIANIEVEGDSSFNMNINFINGNGDDLIKSQDMSVFSRPLLVGEKIKICHGNEDSICSDYVTIVGADEILEMAEEVEMVEGDTVEVSSGCTVPSGFTATVNANHDVEGECRFDSPRLIVRDTSIPILFGSAAAFCEEAGMDLVEGTTVPVLEIGTVARFADYTWSEFNGNSHFDSVRCLEASEE